jgi:CheY-like chemotaxis protein
LNQEQNTEIEGTGLGLSITRSLCKAMGGDISVTSEYQKGSTFTAAILQQIADSRPMVELEKPKEKRTLFYCENSLISSSLGWTLNNLGVPALSAADQEDLLEKLSCGLWDYVLFPAECINQVKDCIGQLSLKTVPVLLGSFLPGKSWDGLFTAFPYHTISVFNAFQGKKNIYSRSRGKVTFICPDYKILVVDDLDINLKIAQGLLAPYQMQITTSKSAMDALKLILENDFDLVLLDQMMPGMDGMEAVMAIRSLPGRKYQEIPIIALTANTAAGIREVFLEKGFSDYLSKPIETHRFNEFLERWIREDRRRPVGLSGFSALNIKELDEGRGLASCFHSREKYQELLELYCTDLDYRLKILLEVSNTTRQEFTEEKKSLLSSNLHILKTACETVGAVSFAETAAELEAGAGWEDPTQLSRFVNELGTFRESILEALLSA